MAVQCMLATKRNDIEFVLYIFFMLKPKLLYIIINVNVYMKRVYPHKAIPSCSVTEKFRKVNFPFRDRVCDDRIRHLNHMRSLIVLSTKVNNLPF